MKFYLFYILFFIMSCNNYAQQEKLILDFLTDCKDVKIETDSIKKKFICDNTKTATNKFIKSQISSLRKEIEYIDISSLKITRFKNNAEIRKQFLNNIISNIYLLKGNCNFHLYFLIENNKISSFTVMDKGGKKVFITLCS